MRWTFALAKILPFVYQCGECRGRIITVCYIDILVHSRFRLEVAASKSMKPVGEDPFRIDHVPNNLFDGPCVGSVQNIGLQLVNRRTEKIAKLNHLC